MTAMLTQGSFLPACGFFAGQFMRSLTNWNSVSPSVPLNCESRIPIPQKHEIPLTFVIEIPASRPCCQLKSRISPSERAKSLSRQTYCRSSDSHPSSVKGSLPLISFTARLFHYNVKGWQNLFHRQKKSSNPWLVYRLLRLSGLCFRYEVRLRFCCFTPRFPFWILLTISITVYAVRCFPTVNPFQN